MKKLVFRKWINTILLIVLFVSVLFMASDCEDTKLFIIVHIIATTTFITSAVLLTKYGRGVK